MSQQTLIPQWVDSTLFPFAHRFTTVDGWQLHSVDEGSGPLLLLLHGNPTWSFLYRQIILGLRTQFRCIALGYPGFGLSTTRDDDGYTPAEYSTIVEHFIEQLDLTGEGDRP